MKQESKSIVMYLRRQISRSINKRRGDTLGENRPTPDHSQIPTHNPSLFGSSSGGGRGRESGGEKRRRGEIIFSGFPKKIRETTVGPGGGRLVPEKIGGSSNGVVNENVRDGMFSQKALDISVPGEKGSHI